MKFACFLACLALASAVTNGDDHPITRVVKMLEGLKAKSIAQGKEEEVAFQKFTYWCKTSITTLKDAIAEEKEKISELEDLISGKKKEKEVLEKEIGTLEEELAALDASAKSAKEDRDEEEELYTKTLSDVKATIQAVNDALDALTTSKGETETALLARGQVKKVLALMSVYSSTTEAQVNTLQAFANQRPDQLAAGDADTHVKQYNFKSDSVVGLLKELKKKFQDDKLAATKAETNAVNSYNLAKSARDNAIKAAEKSKGKKTDTLAKVDNTISESEAALSNEQDDLKADSKGKADTEEQCATKTGEWNDRSAVRENEIAAMDAAMKILSKAANVRTEAPGNPIPPPSPVDFVQVDSSSSPKMSAVAILHKAAQKAHSHALERLAVEVQAHLSGPFDAVNNMIEKMIFRLMDEQKQEDEHKHWCDKELEKTDTMLEEKENKIEDLRAEIASEKAKVQKLTEDIKAADETIGEIVSFKKEATEIRQTGKKENKLAVEDSETAQKALSNAIAVLTEFYKGSGEIKKEAWEFVQKPVKLPENPATWDSSYTGVADPKNPEAGIIAVLENVMADFEKMEAETKAQEASDQKEYEQAMSDNDIEMSRRQQESDMKSDEKKRRNGKISDLESSKKDTTAEHEKTEQYWDDLKPACVNTDEGASYEKRKDARAEEIKALKTAQVTLQDAFKENTKFLQINRH